MELDLLARAPDGKCLATVLIWSLSRLECFHYGIMSVLLVCRSPKAPQIDSAGRRMQIIQNDVMRTGPKLLPPIHVPAVYSALSHSVQQRIVRAGDDDSVNCGVFDRH
jgi:hypothetical protein